MQDVRNTNSKRKAFRATLKGFRAKKQASANYISWQSFGNKLAHDDGVTCPMELEQIFDKKFYERHGWLIMTYRRSDPFSKTNEGVYFKKSDSEN